MYITDTHCFSVELASKIGPDLAIILQFFINVISQHKRLGRNLKQGKTWNYCSRRDLQGIFPYWSEKEIRDRLKKLIKLGILTTGNFNRSAIDRTIWYAFNDEEKWGISKIVYVGPNGQMDGPNGQMNGPNGPFLPLSNTVSNPIIKKDNVRTETLNLKKSCKKTLERTLDISKRWNLSNQQMEVFDWLKIQGINTDEKTLAFWAKTYSLERLTNVCNEARKHSKSNMGGYINTLLKSDSVVSNENSCSNLELAKKFCKDFGEGNLEVTKKYLKIRYLNGFCEDIPYTIPCEDFRSKVYNFISNLG